jgi:SAM-dependent methyltransferase
MNALSSPTPSPSLARAKLLERRNQQLQAIIVRTKVDASRRFGASTLIQEKIKFLADNCERVLDFGRSSREHFALFRPGQVTTTDINQFDGYPDIVDDLCEVTELSFGVYDGIVCLAILEHVYDPLSAVKNLHRLLAPGGYCFAYVPFLYNYHAPADLTFQDYYRYTKDGVAYLFRDFSEVTIFPVRGRFSTILNLLPGWKALIEGNFGQRVNRIAEALLSFKSDDCQTSGYFIWAKK